MIYKEYQRNHVILPGRGRALESFLKQDYKGMQHKLRNAVSSNSEDALTWSCFDVLANLPSLDKAAALDEILEDSFHGDSPLSFRSRHLTNKDIEIYVGKSYTGISTKESTGSRLGISMKRQQRVSERRYSGYRASRQKDNPTK